MVKFLTSHHHLLQSKKDYQFMMKMAIEEESEGSQKNWLVRKTTYAHTLDAKRLTLANALYICILREIMRKMKTLKMVRLLPLEQIPRSKKELISTRFLNNPKLKNTNAGLAKSQPKITLRKRKAPFQILVIRS